MAELLSLLFFNILAINHQRAAATDMHGNAGQETAVEAWPFHKYPEKISRFTVYRKQRVH